MLLEREFTHKELVMISDNFSDEPCIRLVKDFHPVYRLGDKRSERFWRTKLWQAPCVMSNAHFYLPVLYFFHTRVTSGAARASWCLIYLVPLSLTLSVFSPDASWHAFVLLLSGCLAIYSVYELGYIENDTMTIRSEHEPTIRLSQTQMAYVDQHWYQIVVLGS